MFLIFIFFKKYFRFLHGVELCWSYAIPAVLTLILDIRVLLTRPPNFARMAVLREHICKKKKRSLTRKISATVKSSPFRGACNLL